MSRLKTRQPKGLLTHTFKFPLDYPEATYSEALQDATVELDRKLIASRRIQSGPIRWDFQDTIDGLMLTATLKTIPETEFMEDVNPGRGISTTTYFRDGGQAAA